MDRDPAPFRFTYRPIEQTAAQTRLPIAWATTNTDLLAGEEDEPVWPVADPATKLLVDSVSQLFGGHTAEVSARPATLSADSSSEVVVGVGDLEAEATLYAHLTGRRAMLVPDIDSLSPTDLPDVILYCGPRLPRALVQLLFLGSYDHHATGVVWGRDREELHRQLLTTACSAALAGPLSLPKFELAGPNADRSATSLTQDAIGERFKEGVGLFTVYAHSDGICQPFGSSLALCPRVSGPGGHADPGLGPECVFTDHCHRLDRPRREAQASLVSPTAIAARVMLDAGCNSVFVGSTAYDSGWSILPQIVTNPRIGAFLGVTELSHFMPEPFQRELVSALEDGQPVGRAVAQFEENANIKANRFRLLLFGDPLVRAAPPRTSIVRRGTVLSSPSSSVRMGEPALRVPVVDAKLALIRSLAFVIRDETREVAERTSRSVIEKMGELEQSTDDPAASGGRIAQELRGALLDHLATTKVRIFEGWAKLAIHAEQGSSTRCPNCDWMSRPRLVALQGGCRREFFECPSCGDVSDVPADAGQGPVLSASRARLTGGPPACLMAAAAVFVVRALARDTQMIPWPTSSSGFLEPAFDLEQVDIPPGPAKLYAVLLDGLDIFSIGMPVHGGAGR